MIFANNFECPKSKNNLVNELFVPATQHIILKIVGLFKSSSFVVFNSVSNG